VLPFGEVRALGGAAVIAQGTGRPVDAAEWRQSGREGTRLSAVKGRSVVTTAGERIGTVSDIAIDPETGALHAIEIAAPRGAGLMTRRALIQPGAGMRLGPDVVVVAEDASGGDPVPDRDPAEVR
jgi:sporulation protein YlmC with PRC-barrel domain